VGASTGVDAVALKRNPASSAQRMTLIDLPVASHYSVWAVPTYLNSVIIVTNEDI